MNHLRLDLKVCEGCGGLWIRAGVVDGVYCRRCAEVLAEFPPVRCRGRRGVARAGGASRTPVAGLTNKTLEKAVEVGGVR